MKKTKKIKLLNDLHEKLKSDERFWKKIDIKDLINIFLTALGLGFAIYSINVSTKSMDIAQESLNYSHDVDSINRIKDSIDYKSDTIYKNEIKIIQDLQQKLLDSLVSITRISIDKKIFNERPRIVIEINNLSKLDTIKSDNIFYYITVGHKIQNIGIRNAINTTKKVSFYTDGSEQYFYMKTGPFQPILTNQVLGAKNVAVLEKKINKNKFGEEYWSIYILVEVKWYDTDLEKYDSEELMWAVKYFHSGYYITDLLDLNEKEKVKMKIKKLNGVSLSNKYIMQKSFEFFPNNVIDRP